MEKERVKAATKSPWLVLGILSSTLLAVMFSETMLLPAIPEIMRDFSVPYSTSAWVFSAYLIVAAVMTPIAGKLSDIYGSKRVLLVLLALYVAGVVAGGFSTNIVFLLATRAMQGVGFAAVPVAFSILRTSFLPQKLAMPVGVFSSAASGGSVVGLLVGASIIQNFGWHTTFFFIAPVAAVIALLIARLVPGTGRPQAAGGAADAAIDIKGALALSATITSFLVGLTFIENASAYENSLQVIAASFAASAASLAGFVLIEKRVPQPLVNLRLLRHRVLLPTYLMMILVGTTMFLAYPTIVQLVRSPPPSGFGGDALEAAHVQLPFMAIFLIFSSASAFVISKLGRVNPTVFGGIISIVGAVGLAAFHSTRFVVSANLAVIAVGLAMTATANWNLVVSSAPTEFMGISTGIGALLFAIGMAIGPALAGTYMQTYTVSVAGTQFPAPESFTMIFMTSALFSVASLAFSLVLKKRMTRASEMAS
ncbi:MAG: MFS transporter [Nitrososphaera sp.]|jgi:MFS family permease